MAEMAALEMLGRVPIEVVAGPDQYLCGEERALLEVIEGNDPLPRVLPPYQVGLFAGPGSRNPTVTNNVETLACVPHILRLGPDRFRSIGSESSPGTMVFTLSGDVRRPGLYEQSACIVAATLAFSRFLSIESCAQCPACKQGSGEITERLVRIERGEGTGEDVERILQRCATVAGGARCSLPVGESALVQSAVRLFEDEFAGHLERPCPRPRALLLPKLVDFDPREGRFAYDQSYRRKRPDWTYEEVSP